MERRVVECDEGGGVEWAELLDVWLHTLCGSPTAPGLQLGRMEAEVEKQRSSAPSKGVPGKWRIAADGLEEKLDLWDAGSWRDSFGCEEGDPSVEER